MRPTIILCAGFRGDNRPGMPNSMPTICIDALLPSAGTHLQATDNIAPYHSIAIVLKVVTVRAGIAEASF